MEFQAYLMLSKEGDASCDVAGNMGGGGGCWRCLLLPPSVAAIVGKWWSARLISWSWKLDEFKTEPRVAKRRMLLLLLPPTGAAATNLTQRL